MDDVAENAKSFQRIVNAEGDEMKLFMALALLFKISANENKYAKGTMAFLETRAETMHGYIIYASTPSVVGPGVIYVYSTESRKVLK